MHKSYDGKYVGHDEPSLLFYSDTPGAGNSSIYRLTLPKDSPVLPAQDGKGGTWNFQLHPAFWLGMAICDSQSFPEFTKKCEPDTDENVFDDADPDSMTEYGAPLFLLFQTGRHSSGFFVNDNRQILDHNPCTQDLHGSSGGSVPELMNRDN